MQLAPDQGMVPADHPTELRRRCEEEAQQMVHLSCSSTKDGQQGLTNPGLTHLISRLTALLLQIKVEDVSTRSCHLVSFLLFGGQWMNFLEQLLIIEYVKDGLIFCPHPIQCLADGGDLNSFEFKSLTDSLNDIKASIDPANLR